MVIRIGIVEECSLWWNFLGPGFERRQLREGRQVVAAACLDQSRDRFRLRQVDKQALGGFLVLGEAPDAPEVGKERRKSALRPDREAVGPKLFGDLRCVAFGDSPGAR